MDYNDLAYYALQEARSSLSGWWRSNCPFCIYEVGKIDKKSSLSIHISSGFYSCWRCGTKGRIDNDDFVPIEVSDESPKIERINPPEDFTLLASGDGLKSLALKPARRYLAKRKITKQIADNAKIGACIFGDYASRIIAPVIATDRKTWLGFSARDWTDKAYLRYKNPVGMPRGTLLYNHIALLSDADTPVIAVEGIFDALPYWPDVVAFLGKPSNWQKEALKQSKRPIVIVMDGDEHELGWSVALELQLAGIKASSIRLPPKQDPNDVDSNWLKEEVKKVL